MGIFSSLTGTLVNTGTVLLCPLYDWAAGWLGTIL